MTRIEPQAGETSVGRQEMKEIVRRELFFEIFRRKALSCMVHLGILLLVLGIPTYFALAFVAKTGFAQIPVLSAWLYEPAEPVRVIRPSKGLTNDMVLRAIGNRAKYEPLTDLVTASISETELTTLATNSLATAPSGSLPFPLRDLQIAVDPGMVEVFAVVPRDGHDTTLRLRFAPRIKGGSLELDLKELRIGASKVPHALSQFAASSVARVTTEALRGQLEAIGSLVGVETETGTLRFTVLPRKP